MALGFGSCTRSITTDVSQKGQVVSRDSGHVLDSFNKYFLNYDADDPYTEDWNVLKRDSNHVYDLASKMLLNHNPDDPTLD